MLLRIGDALSLTILRRSLNLRVVAAVLASAPTVAIGQTAQSSNQQIRQQIQQQRINAILGTGTGSLTSRKAFTALDGGPGAPVSFAFDLTGPLLFNSNAEALPSGGTATFEGNPILVLEYDPPARWFGGENEKMQNRAYTALGRPRILLQASFTTVSSSLPGVGFNQWTVGPVIKAGWKF